MSWRKSPSALNEGKSWQAVKKTPGAREKEGAAKEGKSQCVEKEKGRLTIPVIGSGAPREGRLLQKRTGKSKEGGAKRKEKGLSN